MRGLIRIIKAKSNIPVKNISLINLWFTIALTFFAFNFTLILRGPESIKLAISIAFISTITLLSISFLNLILCILTEHLYKYTTNYKLTFILISYSLTLTLAFLIIFINNKIQYRTIDITLIAIISVIVVLTNSLILILHNFVLVNYAKNRAEIENSKLIAANSEASNQLLRQQIHPHLLFNSLNILLSLIVMDPKAAEKYLINLSGFLRGSISNSKKKIVKIKDELDFCKDYLELQKVRFGEALSYTVNISDEIQEKKLILAFSIQPLIENSIKHNDLTNEKPLNISIKENSGWIRVSNKKQAKRYKEVSTGTGLSNLSERYRLLVNEEIKIEDNEHEFSVSLKIIENENNNN